MAGVQSRLKRADLEFIIEDIGPELLALMNPKDMLNSMDSERRQQISALLSPKEHLANLSVEDRLANLSVEDRLANLSVEDRLVGVGIEGLLKGMSSEQRAMLISTYAKLVESGFDSAENDDESHQMQ